MAARHRKNALASKWRDDIFLGVRDAPNEYRVGTGNGVYEVNSVHMKPDAEKGNKDLLEHLQGVPWRAGRRFRNVWLAARL